MNTLPYEQFIKIMMAKADKEGIPFSGSFELTSRCTLNCKMCYIHSLKECSDILKTQEKPTSFWCDLLKTCRDSGMLLALLTGGEPTLREDFSEIYKYAKNQGLLVSVNSNATLIDDNLLNLFSDLPPHRISVTLYGTSKQTYKNLCGNENAFDKVVNAIKELKERGINLKLNYSINPFNVNDGPEALDFARSLELPMQFVSYMFPPVRSSCGGDAVRLSAEDASLIHFQLNRKLFGDDAFRKYLQTSRAEKINYDGVCSDRINCHAGSSSFWVTWKGELTPCGMMTKPKILITDFNSDWDYIKREQNKLTLPKQCVTCSLKKYCDMCAAVAQAETGATNSVPTYACEKAKFYDKLVKEFILTDNI